MMPRFPQRGPLGQLFPRFLGNIKALRLPAVRPVMLRFLRMAGTAGARMFRSRVGCVLPTWAWGCLPGIPIRDASTETTGSLKFLGNLNSCLHMFSDPGRPLRP